MPNRMIRDGLLTSSKYERLSTDAKLFFFHLLLCADDLGCIELGPTFIRRRILFSQDSDERIAKLINELQDSDLLRPYQANSTCYGFIPKYCQRVQIKYCKYPVPPENMYCDDPDAAQKFNQIKNSAAEKFNQIKNSTNKSTVGQPLSNSCPTAVQRTVSGKREAVSVLKTHTAADAALCAEFEELWKTLPKRNGGNPKDRALKAYRARKGEGVLTETILAGARRYFEYCKAKGILGTEYVQQAATFLGPSKGYDNEWTVAKQHDPQATAWWASEKATMEMGKSLGLYPRGGEGWNEFRQRIKERLAA